VPPRAVKEDSTQFYITYCSRNIIIMQSHPIKAMHSVYNYAQIS